MCSIINEFRAKFLIPELVIMESDYWVWSLRPHQVTLGSGILSLRRECPVFSALEAREYGALDTMVKVIEKTLMHTFHYDIMNYLMLMMVDKQVHFHIIPRYMQEIRHFNLNWQDLAWPGIPPMAGEALRMEVLLTIASHIRENLVIID